MTIVTTYTCDKCGSKQTEPSNPRQMWRVAINFSDAGKPSYPMHRTLAHEKLWCRDCVVSAGLVPPKVDEPTPEPLTLEEMIREIIQEEIGNSQG